VFVALACSVRVTSAITWAFLIPPLLWQLAQKPALLRAFITEAIFTACVLWAFIVHPINACYRCLALCLLFTLDSTYYGTPTLTPLTFLRINISPISLFYGTAAWHYYLSQALPLLVGPALPFVLHGAYLAFTLGPRPLKLLLYTVMWTSAVFSCAGHKEWRFLHPLVPVTHLLAARSLVSLYDRAGPHSSTRDSPLRIKRSHVVPLALLSLAPALYVARWHSFAQISVLSHLRGLPDTELRSIGFLMPCHSTPAQSHLHRPIPVWRLSCEPPLQ
jgi:GPI mannosyltransferase 3